MIPVIPAPPSLFILSGMMTDEANNTGGEPGRVARGDPFFRMIEEAYRLLERPAPRHVPGCVCTLCADGCRSRRLSGRAARDWAAEDVHDWCARASGQADPSGGGAEVVSRTDRAVFRFLLPRVLEIVAAGDGARDPGLELAWKLFQPARGTAVEAGRTALFDRFAALLLDRSIHDPDWSRDLFETMHFLASGGWSLRPLLRQAVADPDLPAALARSWGRANRRSTLFPGKWPAGAAAALSKTFVSPLMTERLMNFAMAEGTSPEETDAAMRTADLLIRST